MTLTPDQEAEIERRTDRYRKRLLRITDLPQKPKTDRAQRVREQLSRVQLRLEKSDMRRMRMLLQEAKLHMDVGDLSKVYACAIELAHMCRTATLGLEGAHPVLSTLPAPPALPSSLTPTEAP